MGLIILRCIFLVVTAGLAVFFIQSGRVPEDREWLAWIIFGGMMGTALAVIGIDVAIRRKELTTITAVYFGVIVGLLLAWAAGVALTPMISEENEAYRYDLQVGLGVVFCYICISLLMQTKDDFRVIIPYVEFARELKGSRPCVLDTSAVIDGRIADVVDTNIFDSKLVMPKFVIAELQTIADSSDKLRRTRGRRGLDILHRLRNNADIELEIFERDLPEFPGQPVDMKLVILTKHLAGKLVTNDYNLNKVAQVEGVSVVNLNDLANALKPIFLPGEQIEVRVVKSGEEPGQGIGYLDDGTMVVVESGREHIGQAVALSVTSVLQTSAGRMVFGRYESTVSAENGASRQRK